MSGNDLLRPGLYIHVPFCRTKCGYCDFYSCADTDLVADFLQALNTEMAMWGGMFTPFDTVYIGGGTPSLLTPGQIGEILGAVRKHLIIASHVEITVEANPADWGRDELAALKGLGVNRISLGIQSFDDRELRFLGRRHDAAQARDALTAALETGFGSVGVDLIYGLPGQSFASWQASLEQALSFRPGHLSCYELELKTDTPLGLRYEGGELGTRSEEDLREFFLKTSELAEGAGYLHYEVSNFALGPGLISRHNSKYWDHTYYLGLGPSAHSFKNERRWWNHGTLREYLESLRAGMMPMKGFEDLTRGQLAFEDLFLGLRMKQGIDLANYKELHGIDLLRDKGLQIEAWQEAGLVVVEDGRLRPTLAGMAVADALAAQ